MENHGESRGFFVVLKTNQGKNTDMNNGFQILLQVRVRD